MTKGLVRLGGGFLKLAANKGNTLCFVYFFEQSPAILLRRCQNQNTPKVGCLLKAARQYLATAAIVEARGLEPLSKQRFKKPSSTILPPRYKKNQDRNALVDESFKPVKKSPPEYNR